VTDSPLPPDADMPGIPNRSWRRRNRVDPAKKREARLELARAAREEYRKACLLAGLPPYSSRGRRP
jgi:hypothetical protein